MEKNPFNLIDLAGNTEGITGKILAVYTRALHSNVDRVKPTLFVFETGGGVAIGTGYRANGNIPTISILRHCTLESARTTCRERLKDKWEIDSAWMN